MNARANKKAIVDSSRLNGPEKAAIVLLALGEDHNTIWQQLDEEERDMEEGRRDFGVLPSDLECSARFGAAWIVVNRDHKCDVKMAAIFNCRLGELSWS